MREIKFRTWSQIIKKMWYWNDYQEGLWEFFKDLQADDILMQYTGLKDKNGIEIYDGDIIIHCRTNSKWQIRWHNYKWGASNLKHSNTYQNLKAVSQWKSLEVIGNIYEHPALLN